MADVVDANIEIRSYADGDLPRMIAITIEAFEPVSMDRNIELQYGGPINGKDWKFRKSKHIEEDVNRDPDGVFIAEHLGQVVGYITTWHDAESGIGYIPNLAVTAELRGQGIGRQLIEHAVAHFKSLGLKYARIETLEQNPIGQTLYPALGFEEVARQIHFGMRLD